MAHAHRECVKRLPAEPLLQLIKPLPHTPEIRPGLFRFQRRRNAHEPPQTKMRRFPDQIRKTIQVPIRDAALLLFRTDVDLDQDVLNDFPRRRLLFQLAREGLAIHRLDQVGKTTDVFYLIRLQLSNKMHLAAM
ncbi:hypothetical protein SDC9_171156 [bioreactor metagenome]|uniref:Uncharacterized protein n=1 Tax=bioreactor metagenome TaxID=1076179 RepID=A0A645GJ65_9ZZZZ